MHTLAAGIRYVDVAFQQTPRVVATVVLQGGGSVALIDPGPASTLPRLRASLEAGGIALSDVDHILLTHIHLDHAGATGVLVRENPRIRVSVHERGAKHLIDPTKLLASASRLYGDRMEALWGPVLPVPAANVSPLAGGEVLQAGGRALHVAYTPGHASHHVAYFEAETRLAFVGDVGGVRIPPGQFVMPPLPPPDIDLDAWEASIATVLAWRPSTLFLTHFGDVSQPDAHLQELRERLHDFAGLAKTLLALDVSVDEKRARFVAEVSRRLRRALPEAEALRYELAAPPEQCWMGLERYWTKKST